MGSVGTRATSTPASPADEFGGLFGGRIANGIDRLKSLIPAENAFTSVINPNYIKGRRGVYETNCALCTTAIALQARGYDVEAMPRDTTYRQPLTVFAVDFTNPDNYILPGSRITYIGLSHPSPRTGKISVYDEQTKKLNFVEPPRMPKGAKGAATAIEQKVKGWGDGAVGELMVTWKGTKQGHSVSIINDGGEVYVFDGQNGRKVTRLNEYLKATNATQTALVRLDNAPLRSGLKPEDLSKMVRKRGSK